ncbi:MAG: hypothetical protein KJ799_02585 [Bacteroidetes bacterium]|nr:hypothetical protein [Bacteroidota bacterium]MBU1677325.1 hypothetical protein [Bacteroidota bacterium]MBU2505599.1 hypothetical protein [Bacteroidota bacterium]
MSIREFKWTPSEKKIARASFDLAYNREMEELKNQIYEKVAKIKENKDIWSLHDYLTTRRDWVDEKYDYRYSQLIRVFGILIREGYLSIDDLNGLDEEKIEAIRMISEL